MAGQQPARGRAPGDHLKTGAWISGRNAEKTRDSLDPSHVARFVAGRAAMYANQPVGFVRGGVHTVEDLGKTAVFLSKLFNPADPFIKYVDPKYRSAHDQVANAAAGVVAYGRKVVADQGVVKRDIERAVRRANESLNPWATPMAPTIQQEIQRTTALGRNQGELQFNAVMLADGALAARGLTGLGKIPALADEAYLAAGISKRQLADLNKPYVRIGHHNVRQSWTKGLPQFIRDNPVFVVKPPGITKRAFNELHFGLDDSVYGGRLKVDRRGAKGWSGEKLGMQRYNQLDRLAFGTPYSLQLAGAAGGADVILKPLQFGATNGDERAPDDGGVPYRYSR